MTEPDMPDPRVGTVLKDKYRLVSVLGRGGMATVYRAVHRNQAEFAVKMLHPELSRRHDLCQRFVREGYIANSVKHAGVVRVVDDDVAEDGAAFLVMDLIDGVSVEDAWTHAGGRLDGNAAVSILDQLLDVLTAAHEKTIVHRDIKPANLFLTRSGELRVLDFGIARVREAARAPSVPGRVETQNGAMLGTPAFMPPEQALGKSNLVDARSDLWAVGATFFVVVSGRTVHEAETAEEMLVYAATRAAPPVATVVKGIQPAIADIIDRALAFDKDARWPDAASMQSALRRAWGDASIEVSDRRSLARYVASAVDKRADSFVFNATVASGPIGTDPRGPPIAQAGSGSAPEQVTTLRAGHSPARIGATTSHPVSLAGEEEAPTRPWLAYGVAGTAALAAALAFGVRHFAAPPPPAEMLWSTPSPAAAPSASSIDPFWSLPATPTDTLPTAGSAPPRPASPKPLTPNRSVRKANASCDPPYTVDGRGIRHFRPECAE